jgi:prepilin-type N-terminal cleavage/methylation domain-containing protein
MRSTPDDTGFTLVELLLAVMVMLIIIVPISASFVLGVKTASGSLQDTTNSADAQVLAGFFDTDVTGAETVSTSSICAGSGTVLVLSWTDGSLPVEVAYRVTADPAMQAELKSAAAIDRLDRVHCVSGAVVDTNPVARSVLHASGVTVTCDGQPCTTGTPRRISLKAVEYTNQLADTGGPGTYTIAVTATRKVTP